MCNIEVYINNQIFDLEIGEMIFPSGCEFKPAGKYICIKIEYET